MKAREPRYRVFLPAKMRWDGPWVTASVRNVSASGVLVSSSSVPPRGAYVDLVFGSQMITARAIWSDADFCGLRSRNPIDLERLSDAPTQPKSRALENFVTDVAKTKGKRVADHAHRADRAKALSDAFQYLTAAAVATTFACGVSWEVYKTLSAPVASVTLALSGPEDRP